MKLSWHGNHARFYADDSHDQDHHAVEEGWNANFYGTNDRAALVHSVHFPMVNVRMAKHIRQQAIELRHFQAVFADRVS